ELTDSTNMAQGFALLPTVWSVATFVGPLVGGMLARPQDHWPGLFGNPFWGKYPYFLPCHQPTLAVSGDADSDDSQEAFVQRPMANMPLRSLLTPTIVIPIANYATLAFLDVSFRALLPLFLSTPAYLGGLGLAPYYIGSWLAFCGIVDGVFQALFLAKIVDRIGAKRFFCVSVSCFVPLMVTFPIISWLVRARGIVDHTIIYPLLVQLVLTVTWDAAFATVLLFVTASAPAKNVLGVVHGLCQTSGSVARAIGPALATSLFAFSKQYNLLNGNAIYVVFIMLAGVLRWLGSQLPDEIQDRDE
ncbi:major facilitator superfamily domain-containing protein, partial [Suillus ampliporus]